ncbi:MAG: hypothetical protein JWM24_1017 [Solirubrobacterales bacterium]|nr:hypothetical protein [Solirubrobacterales bacterium]
MVALLFAYLALTAPIALAAAPANDDFANAEELSGSLPIEVSRSNVEATKEEPFENVGTFAAGHSVWFEWEATSTEWVTVGSCEADFHTVLGVFTGSALNSLTRVASGNSSEGPHCPFRGSEYTFKATSGTTYEIAVDGNGFYVEPPPPPTKGEFTLRIEATPSPANDDFANATTLVSQLDEESEGETFYFGDKFGYNWNATLQSGEPNHIGGPNGASVWYSWTAPASGQAKISAELTPDLRLGIYTGEGLETLELLFGGIGPGGSTTFTASAGTTYRIVVYGLLNGSSEPGMGNFQVRATMRAPVPVPPSSGGQPVRLLPLPDKTSPDTTIFKRVLKRRPAIFVFSFQSSEPGSTFRCKLDKHSFAACSPPVTYMHLKPGRHSLAVAAVDAAGNEDPTPAVAQFKMPKPPQARH